MADREGPKQSDGLNNNLMNLICARNMVTADREMGTHPAASPSPTKAD